VRKIILASQSKARQKILKQIGLKFCVAVSSIKEDAAIGGRCKDLVIANAAEKAKNVAGRFSSGVVIAADTVVLAGRKLIGKPKNKTDALKILTLLSQKPHWVHSGLAVIDIDRGKMFTAHDKTKVYMSRLKGPGGVFIDRIEGCFYNVVGLPLAKLVKILHRLDVDIF